MNDTIPVTHAEHIAALQRRLDNAETCAAQRATVMDLRAVRIRELEADLAASQRAVIETGRALREREDMVTRLQAKCGDLLERARAAEEDAKQLRLSLDEESSQHAVTIAQRDMLRNAFQDCNRMAAETERKLDAALIRAEAAEAEVSAWETSDCGADVLSLEAKLEEARRERDLLFRRTGSAESKANRLRDLLNAVLTCAENCESMKCDENCIICHARTELDRTNA